MRRIKPVPTLLLLFCLASLGAYLYRSYTPLHTRLIRQMPAVPTPTPPPAGGPTPGIQEWPSADGKETLTMQSTASASGQITYSFSTSEHSDIYSDSTQSNETYTIPFNTWSPQKEYVYLEKHDAKTPTYLVLRANGKEWKTGEITLNVNTAFEVKYPEYTLKEVTGWADETLLIVNALPTDKNPDGLSFWFDVTSQKFIRLSSNFN